MKNLKLFLVAVAMVMTTTASAQIYIGGALGYAKAEAGDADVTTWSVSPEVGYTINDNWAFGVALDYTDAEDGGNTFTVIPYARYTFLKSGAFSVFADGAVEITSIKPDTGDSTTGWGISIQPGVAYAINKNFSVAAHVGALGYWDLDNDAKLYGLDLDTSDLSFSLYYSF